MDAGKELPITQTASQTGTGMYHRLELLGSACETLSNRPFLCRALVAYERLNRPVQGSAWASNLILKMNAGHASGP